MQLLDMALGSGPTDRTRVIHHRIEELLVLQHTVSDGEAPSPVKKGAKHAQSLSCLPSHLFVCRPGKKCILGHPKITNCFDPLYWLSDKLRWSGFLDAPRGLGKENSGALRNVDSDPPIP
jgi:hypothetical protein